MALSYSAAALTTPTNQAQAQGTGPTAALDSDPYSLSQIRYPLEGIGTVDVPHYVVFNINLPTSSKYFKTSDQAVPGANSASQQNYDVLSSQGGTYAPASAGAGAIEAGVAGAGFVSLINDGPIAGAKAGLTAGVAEGVLTTLDLRPKLSRIKKSVAIYMPETITTAYTHEWNSVSATEAGGNAGKYAQLGGGSLGNLWDSLKNIGSTLINNLFTSNPNKPFNGAPAGELAADIAQQGGAVGQGFTDLYVKSMGKAVNPHVEMLFKATQNRQYSFIFHFVPRSQKEALAIKNIIDTFKMYAAPEVSAENGGRYFIPPGQFDISFYFMQAQNQAISKISTCALTNISVNYSGAGTWTTFNDGAPLRIDLELTFTEMDIITRELIEKYGY